MTKHSLAPDIIRSLAGFGVVTIHVTDYFINYPLLFGGLSWWIANGLNSVSRIAVPLFIMLSGYLILDGSKTYTTGAMIKKASRLFALLVVWTLIYLAWRTLWWHEARGTLQMLLDLLRGFMHLYFLYLIIGLYLLTPFIKKVIKSSTAQKQIYLAAITILISALITIAHYLLKSQNFLFTGVAYSFLFIGYYIFGSAVKTIRLTKNKSVIFLISFAILGTLTAYLSYWNQVQLQHGNYTFWSKNLGQYFYDPLALNVILMSCIGFLLLKEAGELFFLKNSKLTTKFFKTLAELVFGIYIVHIIVLDLANKLPRLREDVVLSPILFYISIKITLVFIASAFFVLLIKKIPLLKKVV